MCTFHGLKKDQVDVLDGHSFTICDSYLNHSSSALDTACGQLEDGGVTKLWSLLGNSSF